MSASPPLRREPSTGTRRLLASPSRRVLPLATAGIVVVLTVAMWLAVRAQNASREQLSHTRSLLGAAERALSTLKDAETGQRGFLLTGDPRYLAPFVSARDSLGIDTSNLRRLVQGDTRQESRLDTVSRLIGLRMAIMDSTIALQRAGRGQSAVAIVQTGRGKAYMDSIRRILRDLETDEWGQQAIRDASYEGRVEFTLWLIIAGGIAAVIIAYLLARIIARHGEIMEEQAALIADQKKVLEKQMAEAEAQAIELQAQQQELIETNHRLEESTLVAREAEQRARTAAETRTRFLATMSHELRTPLNAILGYTDLLDAGVDDPDERTNRSYISRTRTAARHLLSLIDDVLSIAKSESEKTEPDLEPVRIGELLHDVVSVISPLASQKKLAFQVNCDIDGQRVLIDRRRVRQVLINVLGNAVKFTPDGDITLTVDCDGKQIWFRMKDSGPGIPVEFADRIFEPFFQAPYKRAGDRPSGVGLGLSVSRQLARAMQGELSVASRNGDRGAEFVLTIPFVDPDR